jgi:hypothetical protein
MLIDRQTERKRSKLDEISVRFSKFCEHAKNEWLWFSLLIPGGNRNLSLHLHVYNGCRLHIAAY